MKQLLLIAFLSFSYLLPAQYAQFPTPGLEFGAIYNCNPFDCADYVNISMRYERDTVLCGQSWSKFGNSYIRAEEGKYWIMDYYFPNCDIDKLMYDFSKNTGDTIDLYDLGKVKVLQTGTFTLNTGEVRKKMIVKSIDPMFPTVYTWGDGIGDLRKNFTRNSDWEGGYGQLICVRDTSGILYENPERPLDCDSLLCQWPSPSFSYSCSGKTFNFINQSQHANLFIWDFGDGSFSTEATPAHTYDAPGCYLVQLSALSDCYAGANKSWKWINVDDEHYWKPYNHQPPARLLKTQFFGPLNGWAYIYGGHVLRTTDGGIHWDTIPYPGPARPISDMHFSDFEHGIFDIQKSDSTLQSYNDLLWTNDGNTFSIAIVGPHTSFTTIERVNDSIAVVGIQYSGLYVTHDYGSTWTHIPTLEVDGISTIHDFDSPGGNVIYFCGVKAFWSPFGSSYMGRSFDQGLTWEVIPINNSQNASVLCFIDQQEGWVNGSGAIYHTTNGGNTWEFQAYTSGSTSMGFVDNLHGWASGSSAGIYGTVDGGQTWNQQACTKIGNTIAALAAINDTLALISIGNQLFRYHDSPYAVTTCQATSSISESKTTALLLCFPNPANDILQFTWDINAFPNVTHLKLFAFNGQEVVSKTLIGTSGQEVFRVDMLPPGLYFWSVSDNAGRNISQGKTIIAR